MVHYVAKYLLKWLLIAMMIGLMSGTASAVFLISLEWVTQFRIDNSWLIWLLPVAGLLIGIVYHFTASSASKGNNLLFEAFREETQRIPFRMAPLVLFGTLITHLFGGSAGREGTAVQMGSALADQLTRWRKFSQADRKVIILMGISAGFASVFGTPIAGAVFALEVMVIGRVRYDALVPVFFSAILADWVCHAWGVGHVSYSVSEVPSLSLLNFGCILVAGICFGIMAMIFVKSTHFLSGQFNQWIKYPPARPLVGGILLVVLFWWVGADRYAGLGVPIIQEAFVQSVPWYDTFAKTFFTALTLGAGFKGGEVTPLFYIGATLGNALQPILSLPLSLLAAMGFVAVFAGATNTPIACTLMGIELFGAESSVYIALACVISYFTSGHHSIYQSQVIGSPKNAHQENDAGKRISDHK